MSSASNKSAQISSSTAVSSTAMAQIDWSTSLSTFFAGLDEYRPTLPDAVAQYYAQKAGLSADDPRIAKFLSLAADKFLVDVINDAKLFSEVRQKGAVAGNTKAASKRKAAALEASIQKSEILEMDDVSRALEQRGLHLRRRVGVVDEVRYMRDKDRTATKASTGGGTSTNAASSGSK